MSERGSFVTEYIYCAKCFAMVRDALSWPGAAQIDELPIMAGKIGDLYAGEELHTMEALAEDIAPCATCAHLMRQPRGNRETAVCGKSGRNAFEERGDAGGCGTEGRDWEKPLDRQRKPC